jgi:ABC-type uncharacterized transport system substrate-binding protein
MLPLRRHSGYVCGVMRALLRNLSAGLFCIVVCATPAYAHPHVWVTMHIELVYAPDGRITGVRHAWTFDDMVSTFAVQGLESKEKGKFSREELAALAKRDVESFKEFDYFTYATADGKKVPFGDPLSDYWLEYADSILTMHFTLPFKTSVQAKELKVEVYDPTIFISFEFAKQTPVEFVGAPQCKLDVELPREMTSTERIALSQIAADISNTTMAWGAQFANKIIVRCP